MSKNKIIIFGLIILLNFILDRVTKYYVINFFFKKKISEYYINDNLNLILVWNKGIAFGLLGFENFLYHLLTSFIFIIIIILIYQIYKTQNKVLNSSYSIIIGGALGNFYDRLYYNLVPDFIDFHYKGFHWFTFNLADISITIGIILLLLYEISFRNKKNLSNEKE